MFSLFDYISMYQIRHDKTTFFVLAWGWVQSNHREGTVSERLTGLQVVQSREAHHVPCPFGLHLCLRRQAWGEKNNMSEVVSEEQYLVVSCSIYAVYQTSWVTSFSDLPAVGDKVCHCLDIFGASQSVKQLAWVLGLRVSSTLFHIFTLFVTFSRCGIL